MRSLIIFGSSTYRPTGARDLDMLVVVDKLSNAFEKTRLEVNISRALKTISAGVPVDVTVFDEESFKENLEPGALGSGLVAGYEILYDELDLDSLVSEVSEKLASDECIIQKNGIRVNLSAFARAKVRISKIKK
ncbi:MAG: hypothetical protein N3F65_04620 [Nitrososphaeria archaeon]|nr:hypothetical protein [Nitrososphaeria archaeon]